MTISSKKQVNNIKYGTLLAIPIVEEKFALSHVYKEGTNFYLIVYDLLGTLDELIIEHAGNIILSSWTNDAEVYRGRWILVGNAPVKIVVPEPEYKIVISGREMIESFDGKYRRVSSVQEEGITFRKSRSPLLVEDAVRAFHGFKDWSSIYNDMLVTIAAS